MAGQVTGNLGSENITLRNMATEDTLEAILQALTQKKILDKEEVKDLKGVAKKTAEAAAATAKSFTVVKDIFAGLGSSAVKIVRNLESNIDNVSYTFSTIAGSLQREGADFASKLFAGAAESVAQLQEQQNSFSQMMRVGGTVASEFELLGQQAAALGVNVRGLAELTDKFSFSLKVGSTSVAGGLKRLRDATTGMSDDVVKEFGRLGIAPQRISEQLLLAAEASGGFGDVLTKYGGNTEKFGKGMLKSTQELNLFASAVGANSRVMQEEAAKASQKIYNRVFMKNLTTGQQNIVQFLQAFTGSGEGAIEVMRSMKGGITTERAGLFQAMKGITGMGSQMETFFKMVGEDGVDVFEALTGSGLLDFAKNISDKRLDELGNKIVGFRSVGMEAEAQFVEQQLTLLKGLKDSKPEDLKKRMTEFKSGLGDGKTLDSFTMLQQNQIKLANTTAGLNKQMNRLGLALATSTLKGTNLGIGALGKGGDAAKGFFNDLLKRYGINAEIPKELLEGPIDKLEDYVDKLINIKLNETPTSSNTSGTNTSGTDTGGRSNLVGTTISGGLIGMNDQITYKDKTGKIVKATLNDLLNNPSLLSGSESFKGRNNRAETLALGAALQKNITTLSAITAGDDNHPKHQVGAHPAGRGLDFAVDTTGKDPKVAYEQAEAAIKNYMENVLGLKGKGDYFIKNELDYKKTGGTGPHMHVEFSESAATQLREKFKMEMAPKPEVSQQPGNNTEVSQRPATDTGATNSTAPLTGTVNNNVSVVSLSKPDWWDSSMETANKATATAIKNLESEFSRMKDILQRNLHK